MDSYNINGKVDIRIEGPVAYRAFFFNEYNRIAIPQETAGLPRVTLRVVDRLPAPDRREIEFKRLFRFRFAIHGLDTDEPKIHFERHWLDRIYPAPLGAFIQGQLLEPVIYLKLLERGILFMHAAGVAARGEAFIFPAHGGTGKTTLALSLAGNGFDLLGDDLLMVDAISGTVHPYARPLHLFTYNLKTLRVPLLLETTIRAKDVLRVVLNTISGERFLIATRAHAEDLMPISFGRACTLQEIIFLTRTGDDSPIRLADPGGMEAAVATIIGSADLNESLYANVIDTASIRQLERQVVTRMLGHVSELRRISPRQMDEQDRRSFANRLSASSRAPESA